MGAEVGRYRGAGAKMQQKCRRDDAEAQMHGQAGGEGQVQKCRVQRCWVSAEVYQR